jgi:hypothetical protein
MGFKFVIRRRGRKGGSLFANQFHAPILGAAQFGVVVGYGF